MPWYDEHKLLNKREYHLGILQPTAHAERATLARWGLAIRL